MDKFLKMIFGLLVMFLLLAGIRQVVAAGCSEPLAVPALQSQSIEQADHFRNAVQASFPSYAELGGLSSQVSLSHFIRVQRLHFTVSFVSLKSILQHLALRHLDLSVSLIRLSDSYPFYRCSPVNEYYIFNLRRILI